MINIDIENEKEVEKNVENCVFDFFACFSRTCRCSLLLLLKWFEQRLHVKFSALFLSWKSFSFFFLFFCLTNFFSFMQFNQTICFHLFYSYKLNVFCSFEICWMLIVKILQVLYARMICLNVLTEKKWLR